MEEFIVEQTRVWDVDNQLVVANTAEEAIMVAKANNPDYYNYDEPHSINAIKSVSVGVSSYVALIRKNIK